MISEFEQLSMKVEQLVQLLSVLRNENSELRTQVNTLTTNNAALLLLINEAHERVAKVLGKLPNENQEVM